ncbi:DUF4153 domain-containing protein [Pontibacter mangrovi]|uniref:DUF4173 domain-containing protein n=1 Tax=Pontibacter mangrovi TaxID=2589816 RepID=A0A501W5A5_9BACT|nr:DUF4173 domain-containing protein [Pontibacter mangrovi]TPE44448.1 DUF4173 domain-containing protein [Pontibacter mangrovi]
MKSFLKKNDLYLLAAVVAYSYLFYRQSPGVNFLLFTTVVTWLLYRQTNKHTRKQSSWYATAGASMLTGFSILMSGSELAVFMNVVSLVLLAGFSVSPKSSVFVAAANAVYSLVYSLMDSCVQAANNKEQTGGVAILAGVQRQHLQMVGIPIAVSVVFLMIYASASSAFRYVLSQIQVDFVSWGWIGFTVLGFVLLFGLFHQKTIAFITEKDLATGNTLIRLRKRKLKPFKLPALKYEYRTSVLLLVMLNLLLLFFILSDAYYLTIGTLPPSVVWSDYLHQGVYGLILSIMLAIGVLVCVFRGNLNFMTHNYRLKQLAYTWLALNAILVLLTLTKNSIYVFNYGLTYKRIGVYTYLTLTTIGLFFSFLKVAHLKNNWFLFRKNAWALYTVLLLLAMFNWDRAITHFNIHIASNTDYHYLTRLSDVNLPELIQASRIENDAFSEIQEQSLISRQNWFLDEVSARDWQSWNYSDWRVQEELKKLE